jgi:hypothetical protein
MYGVSMLPVLKEKDYLGNLSMDARIILSRVTIDEA